MLLFMFKKNAEIERGTPRLVINYKPLNKVLEWIRYPIPNKNDLVQRLSKAVVFSKFDMKLGFWQIQISERDKYKTAFTTPLYIYIYIYIYRREKEKKKKRRWNTHSFSQL